MAEQNGVQSFWKYVEYMQGKKFNKEMLLYIVRSLNYIVIHFESYHLMNKIMSGEFCKQRRNCFD